MRIAIFTDSFYPELGGIQDSIRIIACALGERGHQILIYAPKPTRQCYEVAGLPVREVDLGQNVMIRRLFSLPVPSSTRQSRLILPTGRTWRDLAAFCPEIVHSHTFLGAGWEAVSAARRLRIPLVGTNHWAIGEFSVYAPFGATFLARTSIKAVSWYYNHCAVVTGPSRSVIDEMQAFGLRAQCTVVSNPIDTVLFRPAPPTEISSLKRSFGFSNTTIFYAGRLAVEKNIDVLIRALALLRHDVPDVMLALAGHGSARSRLQRLAQELGVAHRVRFLGTLNSTALAAAFQAVDVFAIASTSETQSMVLLQAMSSGLPVVGARWRALKEFIPGSVGFLAEPGDPKDFARNLAIILTRHTLAESMGRHANYLAQRFSTFEVVSMWEEIYGSTISAFSTLSCSVKKCDDTEASHGLFL